MENEISSYCGLSINYARKTSLYMRQRPPSDSKYMRITSSCSAYSKKRFDPFVGGIECVPYKMNGNEKYLLKPQSAS